MGRGRHARSIGQEDHRLRSILAGFAIVAICAAAIIAVELQHNTSNSTASGGDAPTSTIPARPATIRRSSTTAPATTATSTTPATTDASTTSAAGVTGFDAVGVVADLRGKTIVVDPGHNGGNGAHPDEINRQVQAGGFMKACDTTGTQANDGYPEHAFTFDVSTRLAAILRAKGADVVLTRNDDAGVGPCVNERAAVGNDNHANVALSIHADGGPPNGRGFHVLTPAGCNGCVNDIVEPSAMLGTDLRNAFRSDTPMPVSDYLGIDGLYPRSDLGGLNLSTVPKVFIECGNMRNATDAGLLEDPVFRQQAAQAIAAGLSTYLTNT